MQLPIHIWKIIEIANSFFEVLLLFAFAKMFFKSKPQCSVYVNIIAGIISSLVIYAVSFYLVNITAIVSLIHLAISFLLGLMYTKTKIRQVVMFSFIYFIIGLSSELVSGVVLTLLHGENLAIFSQFGIIRLQGLVFKNILILVIIKILSRLRESEYSELPFLTWCMVLFYPIASVLASYHITTSMGNNANSNTILAIISIFALVYSNFMIFGLLESLARSLKKQHILKQTELLMEIQKKSMLEVLEIRTEIRTMSHDIKHHVLCLNNLSENRKYDELQLYLNKLSIENEKLQSCIDTDNPILDLIVSAKKAEAIKSGIKCNWEINVPPKMEIPELEVGVLLGNSLDNAIEACLLGELNRFIQLKIYTYETNLIIEMDNTLFEKTLTSQDCKIITSKKDSKLHGFGLQSMERCCERLGGKISYHYDKDMFHLTVFCRILSFRK